MRFRNFLLFPLALMLATIASAQIKISGTLQCAKAAPTYTIPVGDQPGHVFMMEKRKCTWTKAPEIAGMEAKDLESTSFFTVRAGRGQSRSEAVGTVANGDKFFTTSQGVFVVKDANGEGTWSITGGTGKLTGIKGKGTFKNKVGTDDTGTLEMEGEYQFSPTN